MTATKTKENLHFIIWSHKQGKEEMMWARVKFCDPKKPALCTHIVFAVCKENKNNPKIQHSDIMFAVCKESKDDHQNKKQQQKTKKEEVQTRHYIPTKTG